MKSSTSFNLFISTFINKVLVVSMLVLCCGVSSSSFISWVSSQTTNSNSFNFTLIAYDNLDCISTIDNAGNNTYNNITDIITISTSTLPSSCVGFSDVDLTISLLLDQTQITQINSTINNSTTNSTEVIMYVYQLQSYMAMTNCGGIFLVQLEGICGECNNGFLVLCDVVITNLTLLNQTHPNNSTLAMNNSTDITTNNSTNYNSTNNNSTSSNMTSETNQLLNTSEVAIEALFKSFHLTLSHPLPSIHSLANSPLSSNNSSPSISSSPHGDCKLRRRPSLM